MGQELLDVRGYQRNKRRYFVATNKQGFMVVRGTTSKEYTHASIMCMPTEWGSLYATFTTREELAKRYSKSWNNNRQDETFSEVVSVKEVSAKEANRIKKGMNELALRIRETNNQLLEANR